ncbi:MAG: alanine racemase [Hyphomonas sp.]
MTTKAVSSAARLPDELAHDHYPCRDEAGRLTVDLGAIAANWRRLSGLYPSARAGAVVKADAYGLGAARIAPMLAALGCRDFFVAHLAEALDLKPLLPDDAALFVLNGLAPGSEARCAQAGIVPVLNTPEQAEAWYALAKRLSQSLPAALQVDTGMSRLGLSESELDHVMTWPDFDRLVGLRLLMSHMACADAPAAAANANQIASFRRFADRLPWVPRSLANSAAALSLPDTAGEVLRPGLVLYGVEPGPGGAAGMRSAIRLDARVIQTRTIPAGTSVGYSFTYLATSSRRIATISAGYADGWPRALSNKGAVWFQGLRLPLIGRVSMDSCVVDVTNLPEGHICPGDTVELIGPHQSVSDLAGLLDTTPHEILTGLGRRFARDFVNEPPAGAVERVA